MAFSDQERPRSFDYIDDPDLSNALEQEAIDKLGLKTYQELVAAIRTEFTKVYNLDDIPPDYEPEIERREYETARRIAIGTVFTAISAVSVIVGLSLKRKNQPENQPGADD